MAVASETVQTSEADRDADGERCCSCCGEMSGRCISRVGEFKEFLSEVRQLCRHINVQEKARKFLTIEELKNRLPALKWIPKYR